MSTKIEWTDEVWNPVTGCNKVSQGCKNCYAETLAKRFWDERKFTDVICHGDRLLLPYKFKRGSRVFVNSMSDLFHEDVPFEFIRNVMNTIHMNSTLTFQILTKRPQRMVEFFKWLNNSNLAVNFPNMWLGVSVENQATADERIPLLLQVPAAVHFLSCEPLLGEVNLTKIDCGDDSFNDCLANQSYFYQKNKKIFLWDTTNLSNGIKWVIVGGESGHGARPMHPDWVRNIKYQCEAANVPFFFKQWGEWYPIYVSNSDTSIRKENKKLYQYHFETEQKEDKWQVMQRIGKKQAGAELDGVEYKCFPHE